MVAVLVYLFLWKTSVGFQLRAVGSNSEAARAAGIPVNRYLILSMTLSGGIAAIASVTEMFGKYHRFIEGFSPSFGFTGIAVAILGKNHPVGVILTALLFGMMDMGALRMSRGDGGFLEHDHRSAEPGHPCLCPRRLWSPRSGRRGVNQYGYVK